MANDLRIKIVGQLDKQQTKDDINKKIAELQGKVDKLNIEIKIDNKILKTLNDFANQMKKIGNNVFGNTNQQNQNLKGQAKQLSDLIRGYKELNKQIKYNRDGSVKSVTTTYGNDKGNGRVINTNSKGEVIDYKDIESIQKFQKEQEKLRKTLSELARTGKYTTTELRNIGKGINVATTIKQLETLKTQMSNMKFDASFNSQVERVRQSLKKIYDQGLMNEQRFKRFNNMINSAKNVAEIEKIQKAMNRVADTGKNQNLQKQLLNQAQTLLAGNSKKLNVTGVNDLIKQLKSIQPNATSASNELKRLQQQLKQYQGEARVAAAHTLTFGSALKQALQGFSLWALTAQAVYAPIRALQDMTQRLIEIDTLMTDIRRVMDMPDFKFTELLNEAVQTSDELSTKLTDVLKVMGDFGRMGFDDTQLVDITKTAQVLQNISDLDATSSVDTLTSAMLNFNIAADQSITIADKLNEVDNNYAISTKDLSDGIRKAAASAKTFGVDINELTGYIAAIGSTTRESGSIVGNGLKTIFSRITTMDDAATALSSVDVSIKDLGGNVRPVSDILEELAGKWTKLSDEQRQNLGVTLAGRFQLTRFLALMNNFSIAQDATKTAINSSGSAMKEQAKYADSLEARINRLDTAWNKFTLAMGNAFLTDSLISGIEALDSLATTVAGFVNKFGALGTMFGIIGVAAVGLNTKFKTFTTSMLFGTTGMTRMQLASAGLTAGMTRLGIATTGVKVALKGLAASTVVGLAFVALGYGLEKLIGAYSDAKQEQEDFEASQQKSIDTLTNNRAEIDKLIAQYEQMTRAKQYLGDNWTVEQETKYLQVQQQLADLYPQLVDHIDGAGRAHIKTKERIEEEIKVTEKLIEAQKKLARETASNAFDDQLSKMDDLQKKIDDKGNPAKPEYFDKLGLLPKIKNPFDLLDKEKIAKNKYEIASLQNQWSNAAQQINSKVLEIASAYNDLKIDSNIQKSVDDFVSSLDLSKIKSPKKLEDFSKKIGELSDKMQKAYQNGDAKAFDKAQDSLVSYAQKLVGTKQHVYDMATSFADLKKAEEMGASAIFAGKDGLDGLDDSATDATDSIESLTQASMKNATVIERLAGTSQSMIDNIKDQITTYQMLSNMESLSADQKGQLANATQFLNSIYPQFIENGKLNVEQMRKEVEAEEILLKAVKDVAEGHADAEEIMTTNQALQSKARMQMLSAEIKSYQKTMEAIEATYEETGMSGVKSAAYHNASSKIAGITGEIDKLSESYSSQIQHLADLTDYEGQYYVSANKSEEAAKKASKSTENSIYVSNKYQQALEKINAELEKYQAILKQFPDYSKEYRDALGKEIDLLKQKKKLIEDQAKSLEKQIKSGNVQQYGIITTTTSSGTNSSSTSSSKSYVSGGSNEANIWNFFKSKGFSDSIVAGIMGNLKMESGLSSTALNKSSGAFGLAQWLGGRKKGLQNFAASRGTSASDLDTQLAWLWQELNSTEKKSLNWLLNNQNASASTVASQWDKLFERSEGTTVGKRQTYANQFYNKYAGSGGGSYVSSSSSNASKDAAETAQGIDQAKSDLLQLQQDALDVAQQIKDIELEIINSNLAGYEHSIAQYNSQVEFDKKRMELFKENFVFQKAMIADQTVQYQKMLDTIDQERGYINAQIKSGKLNAAQVAVLRDKLAELNVQYLDYQTNLKNSREEMVELLKAQKEKISEEADTFIEAYKAFYEKKHDLDQKALDEELDAFEKATQKKLDLIDQEEKARDNAQELSDKQKEIAEIQAKINLFSLDDSKKGMVADLQKELAQKQLELNDYVHDQEVEQRKDALNQELESKRTEIEEKKKINDQYYEDILNDERNFAKMKEDILAGNIQNYQDMMSGWKDFILANLDEIGDSLGKNLIDQLSNATKGLEDAKSQVADLTKVHNSYGGSLDVSGTDTSKKDQVKIKQDTPLLILTENGYELSGRILKAGTVWGGYGVNEKDGVFNVGAGYVTADPNVAKYVKLETGGFTGDGEGLAYLHEKEIVLNKMDTKNFLQAIDITRQMANLLPKFKLPDLLKNPVMPQPNVNLNINIERIDGGEKGANDFFKIINNRLKGKGGISFNV